MRLLEAHIMTDGTSVDEDAQMGERYIERSVATAKHYLL